MNAQLIEAAAGEIHDLYGGKLGYCYHEIGYKRCEVDALRVLTAALAPLHQQLEDRLHLARRVLDEQGMNHVAALIPLEEVLDWLDR